MKPRTANLFWIATAAVVVIELGAGVLMLWPNVDPVYRAYYIDKNSDCWPHRTDAAYVLGTPLSFAYPPKGADFTPNKICGWFYPDGQGDWSYGRYSLLRFNFTPVAGPLTLTVKAGAMVDSAHPAQQVRVSANGASLGSWSFDSLAPKTRSLTIPAGIAGTGHIELRFDYPDARPGNELGPAEDPHPRAIKVETLILAPGA